MAAGHRSRPRRRDTSPEARPLEAHRHAGAGMMAGQGRAASHGFTLMEIILVLVILGVLAGIAMPQLGGLQSTLDLKKAHVQLINDLRLARAAAIRCGAAPDGEGQKWAGEASVVLDPGGDSWVVWKLDAKGCPGRTETTRPPSDDAKYAAHGTEIEAHGQGGDGGDIAEVTFQYPTGRLALAAGEPPIDITLSQGDDERGVCVYATGSIAREGCHGDD